LTLKVSNSAMSMPAPLAIIYRSQHIVSGLQYLKQCPAANPTQQ
jgi:hypothetical protein